MSEWYYLDAQRQVQGPNTLQTMQTWHRDGFLPPGESLFFRDPLRNLGSVTA
jgi:hypothetical protein